VRDVTQSLENYDVPGATRPIQSFVEILSKWYLRRSRRRFRKDEPDDDKNGAFAALYEALVTLSKLLAPSMPFLAEEIYQNLVRSVDPHAPESVHLAVWPDFDSLRIDEELNHGMQLVMKLAALGHSARDQAGIKVRQPLSEAAFLVTNAEEARFVEGFAGLLEDELNVKCVRLLGSAGEAAAYKLNPLPKQLGQKYKFRLPAIRHAILELNPDEAALLLKEGKPVSINVENEQLEILPSEIEVRRQARSGFTVASNGAYVCALKVDLTAELIQEGLAREFARCVNEARKQADYDIANRIHLYVEANPSLSAAIQSHQGYILEETFCLKLDFEPVPESISRTQTAFAGESVTFGMVKTEQFSKQV